MNFINVGCGDGHHAHALRVDRVGFESSVVVRPAECMESARVPPFACVSVKAKLTRTICL